MNSNPETARRRKLLALLLLLGLTAGVMGGVLVFLTGRGGEGGLPALPAIPGIGGTELAPRFAGSINGLDHPIAVAAARDGSYLYVIEDRMNGAVRKIDMELEETVAFLSPQTIDTVARRPMSIALDENGTVYVVDRARAAVDVYDSGDRWLGTLPRPVSVGSWAPLAVAVGPEGGIHVTNAADGGPLLVVYEPSRSIKETIREVIVDGIPVAYASGISVIGEPSRLLLLADSTNGRLVALSDSGAPGSAYGNRSGEEEIAIPLGVVADGGGTVWVSDAGAHAVHAWDLQRSPSEHLVRFGSAGSGDRELLFPSGVAVDANRVIYVADKNNGRVQLWSY